MDHAALTMLNPLRCTGNYRQERRSLWDSGTSPPIFVLRPQTLYQGSAPGTLGGLPLDRAGELPSPGPCCVPMETDRRLSLQCDIKRRAVGHVLLVTSPIFADFQTTFATRHHSKFIINKVITGDPKTSQMSLYTTL